MTDQANNNPGCLARLFPFLNRPPTESAGPLPYRLRDDFLSPAELSFYKVLATFLGGKHITLAKVRLADIFFVARPNENMAFFNQIAQRHVDFLICDAANLKPLFGIELDDSSHRRGDRQQRDAFVESVFEAASLPLVRVPVQRAYTPGEIAGYIAPYVDVPAPAAQPNPEPTTPQRADAAPICPKCGIPMVLRTVSKGEHAGKQFYGCKNYPRCREMRPLPK